MLKEKENKTNAMRILEKFKIPYQYYTYECEEFENAQKVADQLGQPYEKVYKTLVTVANTKEYVVFVVPITGELDMKKAAKVIGVKALELIPVKEIHAVTGYIRGCCTAVGMKKAYRTYIQIEAAERETVIVSGGRIGSQIELAPDDLKKVSGAEYADVIKEEKKFKNPL